MSHATFARSAYHRAEAALGRRPASLAERLAMMIEISRERRALAAADDKTLSDMGVSREQAEAEARRPFWDLPAGR